MQKIKLLIITLVISLATLILSVEGWSFYRFLHAPISQGSQAKIITIPAGASAQKVARILYQAKLIHEPTWFVWVLKYQGKAGQLQAGQFEINPRWRVDDLIEHLVEGQEMQYPVTLIAGQRTLTEIAKLKHLAHLKQTLDLTSAKLLQKQLNLNKPLEGQLLPETYYYHDGETDRQLLLRAHQALSDLLTQTWRTCQAKPLLKTPYEVLILASIVEKETGVAKERPMIAGVFLNRLKRRMRLQSDPTIIYGMGDAYHGNIRKRDILTKTAYNTYRINGLPPTPIALASREAIKAVCHPARTKALYFVAKGNGEHRFSNTLIEHNKAVQSYLKTLR